MASSPSATPDSIAAICTTAAVASHASPAYWVSILCGSFPIDGGTT